MTDHCFVCDRPLSEGSEGNVCQVCLDLTAQYQEKRETRISRLENRAAATRDKASAHAAAARQMAGAIPFGQPILVGHHSETRDRRYRDRIWQKFGQSHAAFEKAKRQEARTDAARRNETFDNGDPQAVLALAAKIEKAQANHEFMKTVNRIIRKHRKANTLQAAIPELVALGIAEDTAARFLTPTYGEIGFADYTLTNNRANIKRMQQRLEELRTLHRARVQAVADDDDGEEAVDGLDGVTLQRNRDENRLQVRFPGKPSQAVRDVMKANGFRWAPSQDAWQRQLTNNAEWAWQRALETIREIENQTTT
jgi:hypothetical protein